jgi:hypothetical protein
VSGLRPLAAWVWVGPGRGDEEVEGERDRPSHVWPRPRPDGAVPAACTDPCTAGASAAGDPSTNQTNPAPCMTYTFRGESGKRPATTGLMARDGNGYLKFEI